MLTSASRLRTNSVPVCLNFVCFRIKRGCSRGWSGSRGKQLTISRPTPLTLPSIIQRQAPLLTEQANVRLVARCEKTANFGFDAGIKFKVFKAERVLELKSTLAGGNEKFNFV